MMFFSSATDSRSLPYSHRGSPSMYKIFGRPSITSINSSTELLSCTGSSGEGGAVSV